ncbi:MAG: hypothetical protein AM1032_000206 [Mycoplasmataceae bacterium]|nr:MAG: hypothetical protein AM1032_000206 [Mycoplasmataceae bacterium]
MNIKQIIDKIIKIINIIFSKKNKKNFLKMNTKLFKPIKSKNWKIKDIKLSEKFKQLLILILLGIFYQIIENIFKKIIFILKTDRKNEFLTCPIRGKIGTKIYDEIGEFTEEYHRIKLIKSLLKKGFKKEYFNLNHKIHIGHKGKNFFIPDLVIKRKNGNCFLVVEVKKNSKNIKEAIEYQLNPARKILSSEYGIYYDGTEKSICFRENKEIMKNFDFLELPDWFFKEWNKK